MMTEFFENLAMMTLEETYPSDVKRLDELTDKEKQGPLLGNEKQELDSLDTKLLKEYDRSKLHFRVNWSFMTLEVKQNYRNKVEAWKSRKTSAQEKNKDES